MNARRQKRVHKTLSFYQMNFGFHPPFNVLLDSTFCRAALEAKVKIKEQFPKYLDAAVNIVTTQCIILEVEKLSKVLKDLYGSWLIVKQFRVHQCGHKDNPQPAAHCIQSLLEEKNPSRYIVATMDNDLRKYLNQSVIPAPIIYLHYQAPVLEKPPLATVEHLHSTENTVSTFELDTLKEMKEKILGKSETEEESKKKKVKKVPHQHPLSCLKSKKRKASEVINPDSKKRRRKKNKQEDIYSSIKKVFHITDS